ncbi:hypothetical protein PM082_009685 [Marasmius tenuissimus]|nr:hypothetical protein PM082_009685 [Marasmius tenuissimus]
MSSTSISSLTPQQASTKNRTPERAAVSPQDIEISDPSAVEDAWEVLSNHARKYDNEMVNGWNEDIDTLLVFFLLNSRSMDRSYEKFFNHPGVLTSQVKQALEKWQFLLNKNIPGRTGLHFILPFYVSERLWTHPDARVREAGLEYLVIYERGWETYTAPYLEPSARVEESEDERYALISSLSKHMDYMRPGNNSPSVLASSQRGLSFLVHTNDQIIRHCLYNTTLGTRRRILEDWKRVISQVRRAVHLPVEYFKEIPDAPQIEILADRGPTTVAMTSRIVVDDRENKAKCSVDSSEGRRSSIV